MFVRCKLLLDQGGQTVEVKLDQVSASAIGAGFTFLGSFSSSAGGIPPERKIWVYRVTLFELTLMDGGGAGIGMGGGGLKFGELADLPPSATLSRALLTERGVEANDPAGLGRGTIHSGADISTAFHNGPVSWRMLSFQQRGSSAWNAP